MAKKKTTRGWCIYCGTACYSAEPELGRLVCCQCGSEMTPLDKLSGDDLAMVRMQDWFAEICRKGLNGPSPQEAAKQLGCHRSMIDRLVERGILERNVFSFKGQKLVIISSRSVALVRENRTRTGNWTGHPVCRGA